MQTTKLEKAREWGKFEAAIALLNAHISSTVSFFSCPIRSMSFILPGGVLNYQRSSFTRTMAWFGTRKVTIQHWNSATGRQLNWAQWRFQAIRRSGDCWWTAPDTVCQHKQRSTIMARRGPDGVMEIMWAHREGNCSLGVLTEQTEQTSRSSKKMGQFEEMSSKAMWS